MVAASIGAGALPGVGANDVAQLILTDADNGRQVSAHVGDEISLHLAENATTGYRWAVESHDPGLEPLEATANYPNTAIGSGGEAIFRFRPVAPGSGKLALIYWRHWEGTGSIIRRFSVTISATR